MSSMTSASGLARHAFEVRAAGDLAFELFRVEEIERLLECGVVVALLFVGRVARGAAEQVEEIALGVAVGDLRGAVGGRPVGVWLGDDAAELFVGLGELRDGVEHLLGGEALDGVVARRGRYRRRSTGSVRRRADRCGNSG